MTKRISIDEHTLFHAIVAELRTARDVGLIRSLYVDEQHYSVTALSEYGEWSVNLNPPKSHE